MRYTMKNNIMSVEINSNGAEVKSVIKNGVEYMWNANPEYWGRTSPVLFPFVGSLNGGIVVVKNGLVLASLSLEIAGLITNRSADEVINDLVKLHAAIDKIAPSINFNPFLNLSFLSLPVIPDIKITDKGLFNVKTFEFINIAG